MATLNKCNPPRIENKIPAQVNASSHITIPFLMNKSVGWSDFDSMVLLIKTVQTNTTIGTLTCNKDNVYIENGQYYAPFLTTSAIRDKLKIGQYYKIQLAYQNGSILGFYSTVATFKCTSQPTVEIKNLDLSKINIHTYTYTGYYSNDLDRSEKVYSYQFDLYNETHELVASSGEVLHNSSLDTESTSSTDTWTTRFGLQPRETYHLVYKIKTVNGLEYSSNSYTISDNSTVPSNLFEYYNFVATNISDSACVQLSLQPKKGPFPVNRKLVNGRFVLLRASSEDNFQTWNELTRFILASWDTGLEKIICNDYTVSQGVVYKYGLQAYTNSTYSLREDAEPVQVDFEDMFLSDGERQLRLRFNPKVSSIKNTILESKLDTLGGKYPFFLRNGNVKYKEFPISGLISMIMDPDEEFMKGIQQNGMRRTTTPAPIDSCQDLQTSLTGDNFRKEREFKTEVLEWLTNGKPKLFRSPGEGSFIVRLMNTSLTPNDTLGRMLHTFQCTAYEIADLSFDNLRKYGMMMKEYTETRGLDFREVYILETGPETLHNLHACVATISGAPGTVFSYRLEKDSTSSMLHIGQTGTYIFDQEVLAENPLIELDYESGPAILSSEPILRYGVYTNSEFDNFSQIDNVEVIDRVVQWIGSSRDELSQNLDPEQILQSPGLVYYLQVQQRTPITVDSATHIGDGKYRFIQKGLPFTPVCTDLVVCDGEYYDGRDCSLIGTEADVDNRLKFHSDENFIDMRGQESSGIVTGGRLVLTGLKNVDCLYLGNGLIADVVYQEISRSYVVEKENPFIKSLKSEWLNTNTEQAFQNYYSALKEALNMQKGELNTDAL